MAVDTFTLRKAIRLSRRLTKIPAEMTETELLHFVRRVLAKLEYGGYSVLHEDERIDARRARVHSRDDRK